MLQEINKEMLIYLNSLSNNIIIEKIVYLFIDYPIFFLPLFLIGYWLYYTFKEKNNLGASGGYGRKQDLLFIFYSVIIAFTISFFIKQFIQVDRPETVINGVGKLLLKHIPDASFPSDHATISFAFLTSLFLANYKKTGYIFGIFVILMNISRIIAGVHWPFDILVGMTVGIIGAFISFKVLKKTKIFGKLNMFVLKMMSYIKL